MRKARQSNGLSQEDLAYRAKINRTYFSKLETGATWGGLEVICRVAKVLGIEPSELLSIGCLPATVWRETRPARDQNAHGGEDAQTGLVSIFEGAKGLTVSGWPLRPI